MNINIKDNMGKGYVKDMYSVNALLALENNEKPISRWTKKEIVKLAKLINEDLDVRLMNKIDSELIKSKFLQYVGFHHVSEKYVSTAFFAIDDEFITNLTNEDLKNLIDLSKKVARTKKEVLKKTDKAELERIERKLKDKELLEEKKQLLKYSKYSDLKHLNSALSSNHITLEELRVVRAKCIEHKRAELKELWIKNNDMESLKHLNDDSFIDKFCEGIING